MGLINGIFVLADGTRLVTTAEHTLLLIAPSGRLATIAGEDAEEDEDEEEDENENMTGGFLDARGSSKQSSWAVGAVSTKSSQNEDPWPRGRRHYRHHPRNGSTQWSFCAGRRHSPCDH